MLTHTKPDLLLCLSIDTEEEWDWSADFPQDSFSVSNVSRIPEFQAFCNRLGIRPTYFIDYAVASDLSSVEYIKPIVNQNQCEIGAHLHPWSNPPYFGYSGEKESHVVNLPIKQVEPKLDMLIDVLKQNLNISPTSFRTGRWGINGEVLRLLENKGFKIDSSMYPFFRNAYFNCENTRLNPYWPDFKNPMQEGRQRNIIEFPVTVGFNHSNYPLMLKLYNILSRKEFEPFRLVGIAWHSRLMRKLYFSPEVMSGKEMKALVDFTINNGLPALHMYMHSSSLIDNATGLMPGNNSINEIYRNIEEVLDYAKTRSHLKYCTITEAATLIKNRIGISGLGK